MKEYNLQYVYNLFSDVNKYLAVFTFQSKTNRL